MAPVWLRFRAELRRRWRAWVGLGLLLGLAVGVVAAVVAAGRRADTVADRFHESFAGYDAYLSNFPDPFTATYDPAQVAALPMVASSARVRLDFAGPGGNSILYTPQDSAFGSVVQRFKVLDGRLPDPARADEVVVAPELRDAQHLRIGARMTLFDPAELEGLPQPTLDAITSSHATEPRVVGVVATPNSVVLPRGQAPGGVIFGTRALHDLMVATDRVAAQVDPENTPPHLDGVMVRFHRGAADTAAFEDALRALPHKGEISVDRSADATVNLERSTHLQAVTLWLLAGLLVVVGLASVIATFRQSANVDALDAGTLRALGTTSAQLNGLAACRGILIAIVGSVVAAAVAILLSPRMLFGVAREVEPNEGVSVDWTVLCIAIASAFVLGVVVALVAGVLARRSAVRVAPPPALRLPATSVPAGVGVRFACARWSLLVRGIVGPAIGIAALVGALVFSASLGHLRSRPALYGWQWDLVAVNYGDPGDSKDPGTDEGVRIVQATPGIEGAAIGNSLTVRANDQELVVLALDVVRGDARRLLPPVVDGRAPAGPQEIALAAHTMQRLHTHLGGHLTLTVDGAPKPVDVTVVGQVVVPPVIRSTEPGEGALMPNRSTYAAFGIETGKESAIVAADSVYVRTAPHTSSQAVLDDLNQRLGGSRPSMYTVPRVEPSDLVDFGHVDGFPLLLGAALALLAASTLVHVLVASVRQRRQDLATLRALGLQRRQVRAIVASEAAFLVGVAVLVGVPLGILMGNVAWSLYAQRTGFIAAVRVPALALLLVGVLALIVAELCAAVPARIASRTRPAQLLRGE